MAPPLIQWDVPLQPVEGSKAPLIDQFQPIDRVIKATEQEAQTAKENIQAITEEKKIAQSIQETNVENAKASLDLLDAQQKVNIESQTANTDFLKTEIQEQAKADADERSYLQKSNDLNAKVAQTKLDRIMVQNQDDIRRKEVEAKVLQARSVFESELPWAGFSSASQSYVSNIVSSTNESLYAFKQQTQLSEVEQQTKISSLISDANFNYLKLAKEQGSKMRWLKQTYISGINALNATINLSPLEKKQKSLELEAGVKTAQLSIESNFRSQMNQAQWVYTNSIKSQSDALIKRQELASKDFDRVVATGEAFNMTPEQLQQYSNKTGVSVPGLIMQREAFMQDKVSKLIIESKAVMTPAQVQSIMTQAKNLTRSGMSPSYALGAISGNVLKYIPKKASKGSDSGDLKTLIDSLVGKNTTWGKTGNTSNQPTVKPWMTSWSLIKPDGENGFLQAVETIGWVALDGLDILGWSSVSGIKAVVWGIETGIRSVDEKVGWRLLDSIDWMRSE